MATLYRLEKEITLGQRSTAHGDSQIGRVDTLNRDNIAVAYDEVGEINIEFAQVDHIDPLFKINDSILATGRGENEHILSPIPARAVLVATIKQVIPSAAKNCVSALAAINGI